jgi:hypothetical protein
MYEFNSRATGVADGEMLAFFERARVVARSMAGSHRWRPFKRHFQSPPARYRTANRQSSAPTN